MFPVSLYRYLYRERDKRSVCYIGSCARMFNGADTAPQSEDPSPYQYPPNVLCS